MKEYYRRSAPESKLDNLTVLMIKATGKGPKLRGRAGEIRGLIPFGKELADQYLDANSPREAAIKECTDCLVKCYDCLSSHSFSSDVLKNHARRFALLYSAIEAATDHRQLWRVKPKLHLWLNLCESGNRPSLFWGYRDEDFGGCLARLGHRRGGSHSPVAVATNVLSRFCAMNKLPVIM